MSAHTPLPRAVAFALLAACVALGCQPSRTAKEVESGKPPVAATSKIAAGYDVLLHTFPDLSPPPVNFAVAGPGLVMVPIGGGSRLLDSTVGSWSLEPIPSLAWRAVRGAPCTIPKSPQPVH